MTLEQLAALLIESYFYKKKQELGRHLTKSELDKVWRDILSEGGIPRKFDKSHDDIFKIIQTHVEVRQEEDVSIVKDVRRWLDKKKKEGVIDFPYWKRYKKLLLKSLPYDVVDTLDKSTDKIIDFSGDPQLKMDTRGLVMGEVQSGKTASYTGVICKAADLGYKVIIVLTTSNEKLRSQTQQRLDKEFVGYCNVSQLSTINIPGYLTGEEKRAESRTNILQDFGKAIKSATSFNPNAVSEPYFFVCKKEANNLNHLIKWLSENLNSEGKNDAPLLLIDDECDYASVNTKDPNKDPTRINEKLREILDLFTRSSYIGYSATPFANVFIDPDMPKELKEDLFPRNFINYIKPPSNYNGREKIFGKTNDFFEDEDEDTNRRDEFITLIDDNEDIFPVKYKPDHEIHKLPDSLKEAIRLYIVTVALLELNNFKMHKTMMIHVSKLVRINKDVFEFVSEFVKDVKNSIYACKDFSSSSDLQIKKLKVVFDDFYTKEKKNIKIFNFEKVFKQLKELATENWIEIQLVIGKQKNIGYEEFFKEKEKHMNVLMIGGDIISRGLTLEGLITSYFIRNPGGYDTLMQMARWFGYRVSKGKSYEEACQIYMTSNSLKAYTDVNIKIDDLIEQLHFMEVTGKTPAEFGLRVSTSELLNITAKNKLRNSQILVLAGNYEQKLVQANYVINNKTIQKENHQLLKNFFDKVSSKKSHNYCDGKPFILYENIEGSELLNLLKSFSFSDKAEHFVKLDNKTGPLYEWIEKRMNDEKELKYWNIAIPISPSKKKIYVDFLNTELPIVSRSKCKVVDGNLVLNVKEKTDFSRGVYATNEVIPLLNEDQEKKYKANKDKKIGPLKYLEKPTVLLYVIDFKLVEEKQEKLQLNSPLATILLYLPSSEKKETGKQYLVNKTYIKMLEKEREERDDEPGGDEEDD